MARNSHFLRWQIVFAVVAMIFQVACNKQQPKVTGQASQTQQQFVKSSKKLRINIGYEPCSLDPAKARDLQSITLVKMLFDGLTRIGRDDKIEMAMAEKVLISEDELTYTFTLRDAKWSNGDPVVAENFLYSWERGLDPNTPSENASQLYVIKNASAIKSGNLRMDELGVKVIDDKTLQVELEHPTPCFLELTSYPAFYPINGKIDLENPNWFSAAETYVGNGPFSLAEWKNNDFITMKNNPNYWDHETVHLEEISMYMLQSETELSMFENHEIDWAGSPLSFLPIDALGKLKSENLLHKQPVLGTYFLRLNTDHRLLRSNNIRKALSLSINREEIVEQALAGSQVAASGYVPEIFGLRQNSYFQGDHRHEAMRCFEEGLDELTLMRTEVPELDIIYPNSERNQRIAQLLQERWQKVLGIKLNLFAAEPKVYFEKVARGDYDISIGAWMADFNDPIAFLEIFKHRKSSANHTHWENKEYASLIDSCSTVLDVAKRKEMLARCEKILIDSMPVIPIFHYNLLYIKDSRLQDVFVSNMGIMDFRWAKFQ